MEEFNIEKYLTPEEFQQKCENCMLNIKGECFGRKAICEDYSYAPQIDEEIRKDWPKIGDATYYRMTQGRK